MLLDTWNPCLVIHLSGCGAVPSVCTAFAMIIDFAREAAARSLVTDPCLTPLPQDSAALKSTHTIVLRELVCG